MAAIHIIATTASAAIVIRLAVMVLNPTETHHGCAGTGTARRDPARDRRHAALSVLAPVMALVPVMTAAGVDCPAGRRIRPCVGRHWLSANGS
jgi:hypothetical protein